MADTVGQQDIRGLQIEKMARSFADEALVLKNMVRNSTTSSRTIRWYTKTAGFLDSTDTTGITASQIANTAEGALPVVVEPSWTREESNTRKYFVESPTFSIEDLRDTDPDVFATTIRDLVRAVGKQVDTRILAVLGDTLGTGGSVNTAAGTGTGWDDAVAGNPILDILTGIENIRLNSYKVNNIMMYIHPGDYTNLINWIITVKGSSIPSFSSEKVKSGTITQILGVGVRTSVNASEDTAVMFLKESCTWKSFVKMSTAVIDDPGIGKKVRVWEEGEAMLQEPKSVHVITDILT